MNDARRKPKGRQETRPPRRSAVPEDRAPRSSRPWDDDDDDDDEDMGFGDDFEPRPERPYYGSRQRGSDEADRETDWE